MRRYFLVVVLVLFGCVVCGIAQEKLVRMPVIDSVVEYAHGDFGSHGALSSGDTMTLNLNAIDKIRMDFPQGGPFRVEHTTPGLFGPDWFLMKLVSSGPDPRVTIYIRRFAANHYEITIIAEAEGHFPGFAILEGDATD